MDNPPILFPRAEFKKRKTSGAKFSKMENSVLSAIDRQFCCVRVTVN